MPVNHESILKLLYITNTPCLYNMLYSYVNLYSSQFMINTTQFRICYILSL